MCIIHSDEHPPLLKEHKWSCHFCLDNAPVNNGDIPVSCLEYYAQEQNNYTHKNGVEIWGDEETDCQGSNSLSDGPL